VFLIGSSNFLLLVFLYCAYYYLPQERVVDCSKMYSIHDAASNYIKEASVLSDSAQIEGSILLLKKGIDVVGDFYKSEDVIDDSGVTITLAEVRYSQRQLNEAYNLYYRALHSRVEMINDLLKICKP